MKKKKVGTLLDAQLVKQLKIEAVKEGEPFNALLERALWNYLEVGTTTKQSFADRTKGLLKVSRKKLKAVLEKDEHDT